MARLGDRIMSWDCYKDEYERVVYDNGKYAVYSFDTNRLYARRTKWHLSKQDALAEFKELS